MQKRAYPWMTATAFGCAGVAIGLLVSRNGPSRGGPLPAVGSASEPEPRQVPIVVAGQAPPGLAEADRVMLRNLIREEIRASLADQRTATADASESPAADGLRTAERLTGPQRKACDEAQAMVDRAVAHGSWSGDDRERLRQSMTDIPGDLQLGIVRPLIVAVNAGQVRFTGRGPVF